MVTSSKRLPCVPSSSKRLLCACQHQKALNCVCQHLESVFVCAPGMNLPEHPEVGYGDVPVLFYRWCHRSPERFGDWPWKPGLTPGLFMGHAADSFGLAPLQGGWEQERTFLRRWHLLIFAGLWEEGSLETGNSFSQGLERGRCQRQAGISLKSHFISNIHANFWHLPWRQGRVYFEMKTGV